MNTKAQDRVAIAQDALSWLKADALYAAVGRYVRPTTDVENDFNAYDKQLRDVVLGRCGVCVLGALFLAHVVRFDNCLVGDGINDRETLVGQLGDLFGSNQMNLIEYAFEGPEGPIHHTDLANEEAGKKARAFYDHHIHTQERFIAILENIVKNKGTFRP